MILYFTGTGNSKYIAYALADRLEDSIVSLNDVIKSKNNAEFVSSKPYVIVAPIYAWRLPKVVDDVIFTSTFLGSKDIYFVATMGSQSGKCDEYTKLLCQNKHMTFKGFRGIAMPNNYVIASKMDDEQTTNQIINNAIPQVDEIAMAIKNGETISKTDTTLLAGFMSGTVNKLFYKFCVNDKNFVVSDDCVNCGLCEKLCPLNNITIKDGKPIFGGNCTNCYACIHHCPKEAINIKGKTENHGRYVCKEYKK